MLFQTLGHFIRLAFQLLWQDVTATRAGHNLQSLVWQRVIKDEVKCPLMQISLCNLTTKKTGRYVDVRPHRFQQKMQVFYFQHPHIAGKGCSFWGWALLKYSGSGIPKVALQQLSLNT